MIWKFTIKIPLGSNNFYHKIKRTYNSRLENNDVKVITDLSVVLQNRVHGIVKWYFIYTVKSNFKLFL